VDELIFSVCDWHTSPLVDSMDNRSTALSYKRRARREAGEREMTVLLACSATSRERDSSAVCARTC